MFVMSISIPTITTRRVIFLIGQRYSGEKCGYFLTLNNYRVRTPLKNNFRYLTSSNKILDMVPESVREAVKSSILDEAIRNDSNLWSVSTNDKSGVFDGKLNMKYSDDHFYTSKCNKNDFTPVNGNIYLIKDQSCASQHHLSKTIDEVIDTNDSNSPSGKNIPSVPTRSSSYNVLNDPLEDWYLNEKPKLGNLKGVKSLYRFGVKTVDVSVYADPFKISKGDMQTLCEGIRNNLMGSAHPDLTKAASYFFEQGQDSGKKIRPMMILLLSRAMVSGYENTNLSLLDENDLSYLPMPHPQSWQRQDLPQAQRRLAEISEMIHTASLFHDDVIDQAHTRRQSPSVHKIFGNKMAILAGDYLLARASIFLARLKNVEVVETMSTIIEHLVRGEVMQMKNLEESYNINLRDRLVHYMRKNFYKTASLMANSCKSAAILGGYGDDIIVASYKYGKHLGVAFQLIDDILDFEGNSKVTGKPLLADLTNGLATAPVLFAAEMYPNEMQAMINRKFKNDGDVGKALEYVRESNGIERTKTLALVHAELAVEAILKLQPSVYRDSLVRLVYKVVDRTS